MLLVSTHNLGSVPEFCDRVVLINRTVLAAGPTEEVFTQHNIEAAFGGVLAPLRSWRRPICTDDDDTRQLTVITDDERPFVVYEDTAETEAAKPQKPEADADCENASSGQMSRQRPSASAERSCRWSSQRPHAKSLADPRAAIPCAPLAARRCAGGMGFCISPEATRISMTGSARPGGCENRLA